MLAFAYGHTFLGGSAGNGLLHGLQLVAVAVVAQAVLGMQRSLAPDRVRIALAILATGLVLFLPAQGATLIAIAAGAVAGLLLFRQQNDAGSDYAGIAFVQGGGFCFGRCFFVLLVILPLAAHLFSSMGLAVFRLSTAVELLVFGGGHVVLPLLEDSVVARGGYRSRPFSPDMAPLRLFPARFSHLPHTLARRCVPPPIPSCMACSGWSLFCPRFARHDSRTAILERAPP